MTINFEKMRATWIARSKEDCQAWRAVLVELRDMVSHSDDATVVDALGSIEYHSERLISIIEQCVANPTEPMPHRKIQIHCEFLYRALEIMRDEVQERCPEMSGKMEEKHVQLCHFYNTLELRFLLNGMAEC